jgi:hypothetical protein
VRLRKARHAPTKPMRGDAVAEAEDWGRASLARYLPFLGMRDTDLWEKC